MKKTTLLIIFLAIPFLVFSQKYEFSPTARLAYERALALRFGESYVYLAQMRKDDPSNLMADFIENYIDCLTVFIGEEKPDFDRLQWNQKKRLDRLQNGDASSPYHLYTQAQIQLMWAMNRVKFGEYVTAFNDVSSAYEKLEANQKKFPSFVANKMSLGVLHSVVGSIPDNYKWTFKFLSGMNGTVQQGQAEIEEVIRYAKTNDFIFEQEAIVMYAFLMLHLNNQNESAWNIVNSPKLKPRENALAAFALANVAIRTGRNDKAIEILSARPRSNIYYNFHYLDYLLGLTKLYRGDADAENYIQSFVNNFKGRNYIKEAFQRLAWSRLLNGDWNGYYKNIEFVKTRGRAEVGGDKNALKEAKSGSVPEWFLLKARLHYDGGYYQKAYDVLKDKKSSDFKSLEHQLEFSYRMGRILKGLKRTNEAIVFFNESLQKGKNTKFYFPCNSALQLGLIYEEYKQYTKAREFFNFCLQLNPDDYGDVFHSKAKAGLNRIKGK